MSTIQGYDGWAVTDVHDGSTTRLFSSERVAYVTISLAHETGAHMSFSHRADDPAGVWAADSAISPNGMPQFVHGEAARDCDKRCAPDELAFFLSGAAEASGSQVFGL